MKNSILLESSWFQFADMDLEVALHLNEKMYPKPMEIICYHCEQAVEKYLKGFLLFKEVPVTKTHNVSFLLEEIEKVIETEIENKYFEMCDMLIPFGVAVRYPNEVKVDDMIVKEAIESVREIRKFILEIL